MSNDIITGKTPKTKNAEYYNGEIPFIKIPDIHKNVYSIDTIQTLTKTGAMSQSKKYIPANSIVVSCIGTPGLTAITTTKSQTNQQINSIVLDRNILYPVYLELSELKNKIINLGSSGTTINNLNKKNFSNIELNIPKINELKIINKKLDPIFLKIKNNQFENKYLNLLKNELITKLLN